MNEWGQYEPLAPYGASDDDETDALPPAKAGVGAATEFLADMIGQLEAMARSHGLDLLTYLLSMARLEAETQSRSASSPGLDLKPKPKRSLII